MVNMRTLYKARMKRREMFFTVMMVNITLISRMGARYMTLTHSCNTPWAEAAQMEEGGS